MTGRGRRDEDDTYRTTLSPEYRWGLVWVGCFYLVAGIVLIAVSENRLLTAVMLFIVLPLLPWGLPCLLYWENRRRHFFRFTPDGLVVKSGKRTAILHPGGGSRVVVRRRSFGSWLWTVHVADGNTLRPRVRLGGVLHFDRSRAAELASRLKDYGVDVTLR